MTLLEIVQEFCRRQGLPVPSAVVSLGDDQLTQIVGLANEICEDLDRFSWTQLVREASWTATGAEDQGAMSVLAPFCCSSILNETIYNRTTRLPIYGPVSARQWQADKALFAASPTHEYRIFGGHLYITPAPPDTDHLAFEYRSSAVVYNANDNAYKPYFTKDDDEFLLPPPLLLRGLRWRWKAEKGFPYAEDFRLYETAVADANGRDGGHKTLTMDGCDRPVGPGIVVQPGNWNVS